MKLFNLVLVGLVVAGAVLAASALSQPRRDFTIEVLEGPKGFTWRMLEPDGTVIASSSLPYATEDDARAAARDSIAVDQS